jgi:hypothetical protein
MVRHCGRVLEHAAVLEISGDARGSKRVIADERRDAGSCSAPADHGMSVRLWEGALRQYARAAPPAFKLDRAKKRALGVAGDAGSFEIFVQINFEIVVARHLVVLAAFFVQAHPQASVLNKDILNFHGEGGADARERIDHEADQRAIARSNVRAGIDAVEQAGVLPFFTT